MFTFSDRITLLTPVASASEGGHLGAIEVEVTVVPVVFAARLDEEAQDTVVRDFNSQVEVAHHVADASATALQAVGAFVRIVRGDGPRIVGSGFPIELAEVAGLEVFNHLIVEVEVPPNLDEFFAIDLNGLGADISRSVEDFVHDEVDVIDLTLVRGIEGQCMSRDGFLITFLVGNGHGVVTNVDLHVVVTVVVGGGSVGVLVAKFVGTGDGDGDAADRGDAVLLVSIAVDTGFIGVTRHLHDSIVREGGFTFVVDGGDVELVTIHVVRQFAGGHSVGGHVDLVDGGTIEILVILVDVVVTIGTVDNRVPVQSGGLAFEEFNRGGGQVLRHVEVRGEAPDVADGGAAGRLAAIGALVDTPEVVGVVPEVGHSVFLSEVVRPVDEDGLRMRLHFIVRPVGRAEGEAVLGAVRVEQPLQGHAVGLDAFGVVDRSDHDSLLRARQVFDADFNFEVSGGIGDVARANGASR